MGQQKKPGDTQEFIPLPSLQQGRWPDLASHLDKLYLFWGKWYFSPREKRSWTKKRSPFSDTGRCSDSDSPGLDVHLLL